MTGRLLIFLLLGIYGHAQHDSIALREVVVPDRPLSLLRETSSVVTFPDSVIARDGHSLVNLLRNTPVYFKENGLGMVASPAFRGTTAQHTAVIWNGINVNSPFHGQTDFNASGARDFDQVTVRGGGMSTAHGSSAIGGTVHLENRISFTPGTAVRVDAGYGSFNTSSAHARIRHSARQVAFSASASQFYSDNDYALPSGRRNANGRLRNQSLSTVGSWRAGERSTLTYYGYSYNADRNFSLLFPTDPETRYRDTALRNMLEWSGLFNWFSPTVKAAVMVEEYRFYEDALSQGYAWGRALSNIFRADAGIRLRQGMSLNLVAENNATSARGSDVGHRRRNVFSASALMRHEVNRNLAYSISIRQEAPDDYRSPLLFASAARIRIAGNHFAKAGIARSFRAPTFNDLYWGTGGNPDLRPETSLQAETGYHYDAKWLDVQVTGFANHITDMIRWLPAEAGQWFPVNEHEVRAYGLEILGTANGDWGRHKFSAGGHYAYTVSENGQGRQLIYVPLHKSGATVEWHYRDFSAMAGCQYTGPVHTRTDNDDRYVLDGYAVADLRAGYTFGKFGLNLHVRNLFDRRYQVVERRYFPGRNFMIELTFKT